MQRKREAKNIWLAVAALGDLVKAMQGIASSGDILDTPSNYDPQKTLQTFATYQTNFAQLRQWLHRLQPPPECLALHQAYDQALQAHINTVGKLQERVQMKDLAGTAMPLPVPTLSPFLPIPALTIPLFDSYARKP
jgi:hypothetical protein